MLQLLQLSGNEMDVVATFMGHDIRVHRKFYRLPDKTVHAAKIAQILLAMDSGIGQYEWVSLDDLDPPISGDSDRCRRMHRRNRRKCTSKFYLLCRSRRLRRKPGTRRRCHHVHHRCHPGRHRCHHSVFLGGWRHWRSWRGRLERSRRRRLRRQVGISEIRLSLFRCLVWSSASRQPRACAAFRGSGKCSGI